MSSKKEYPLTPSECYPPSQYDSTTRPPFIPNNDAKDKFTNLGELEKKLRQSKKHDTIARVVFAVCIGLIRVGLHEYNLLKYEYHVLGVEIVILLGILIYFNRQQTKIRNQMDSWINF